MDSVEVTLLTRSPHCSILLGWASMHTFSNNTATQNSWATSELSDLVQVMVLHVANAYLRILNSCWQVKLPVAGTHVLPKTCTVAVLSINPFPHLQYMTNKSYGLAPLSHAE